ncbi:MAG: response regulator, partial [Phycisphaerales bacterium]
MTPLRLNELLDEMDAREQEAAASGRGAANDDWVSFRRSDVPVEMEHPGGGKTRCRACAWRISKYGIGMLWSGYVHPGTQCEIELTSIWGSKEVVRGVVRGCRHVDGTVHELDVRFLLTGVEPIDLGRLLRDDVALARLAAKDATPKSLSGRMAFFDESELMTELVTKLLNGTSMEVVGVRDKEALLDTVRTSSVDMVLFTDTAGIVEGEGSLIRELRDAPYTGSIIVVTSETDRNRLDAVKRAGATGTLQKPFDRDTLMGAVARWLERTSSSGGGAVYSELANDESVRPLLKQFIDEAQRDSERVREAATRGAIDEVRRICRSIGGAAGCFGFTELS